MRGGKLPRVTRLSMASRAYGNRMFGIPCSAPGATAGSGCRQRKKIPACAPRRRNAVCLPAWRDGPASAPLRSCVVDAVLLGVHLEVHARLPLLAEHFVALGSRRKLLHVMPLQLEICGSCRSSICLSVCCALLFIAARAISRAAVRAVPVMQLFMSSKPPTWRCRIHISAPLAPGAHLHFGAHAVRATLTSSYSRRAVEQLAPPRAVGHQGVVYIHSAIDSGFTKRQLRALPLPNAGRA